MRRRDFLLACPALLVTLPGFAKNPTKKTPPKRVPAAQAGACLGQVVTVIGKIAEVSRTNYGGHIYLNFGAPYPRQEFSVVIFKNEVKKFPKIDSLRGKTVEITGLVRNQQGNRRIQLVSPNQLLIR